MASQLRALAVRGAELYRSSRVVAVVEIGIAFLLIWLDAEVLLLPIAVASVRVRDGSWRPGGWPRAPGLARVIFIAAGVGVAYAAIDWVAIVPLLVQATGNPLDLSEIGNIEGDTAKYVSFLALGWFAAFVEEYLYRGYLLNRFAALFGGTRAAWLIALGIVSLEFALGHGYQGLAGVIDNLLSGLILGATYLAFSRRLSPAIALHGMENTVSFTGLFLGWSLPSAIFV